MAYNSMDYSAKDTLLDVIRKESGDFFAIVDDPKNWNVQTRCEEWEVRDIVGHMIDVTEGYLTRWDMARKGEEAPTAWGLVGMDKRLNEHAQAFRSLPRDEAIARLKGDYNKMFVIFSGLDAGAWNNFMVAHPYMGPLPPFFYPAFQVIDYGIHTWDMRWGLGDKTGKLDERTAGVLVPHMFIVMQYTVDQESAKGLDTVFGIKVDGEWGGQWRVTIKDGTFKAEPSDDLSGTSALFHFKNASDFVLTVYQRFPGGETSGDPETINRIRHLFFKI